jgi:hypothetical protein
MTDNRRSALQLVSLAVRFLKHHHPSACRTYADLFENPLFRGTIHGLDEECGLSQADIQKEVSHILPHIQSTPNPISRSPDPRTFESYLRIACRGNLAEMNKLPREAQAKVWQLWVENQIGAMDGRTADFDAVHAEAQERVRTVGTLGSEAVGAGDDDLGDVLVESEVDVMAIAVGSGDSP